MASSSGLSSVLVGGSDTIVARATPAGSGALAIVRVSGEAVVDAARRVCPAVDFSRSWRAQLVDVLAPDGTPLERAVAIPYRAPRSYTGEDMLELVVHGSAALVAAVLEAWAAAGVRAAVPGEFTRRAVANGKMDLLQAEAVRDLVQAESAWQLRLARSQLTGELSRRIGRVREQIVELRARLEGVLELAGQGVDLEPKRLRDLHGKCGEELQRLLASERAGERIRDGVKVVISGPPNSGKSTLFNRLLRRERAIVSPQPGTTRDVLEAQLEVGGLKVVLVDTAGVGATQCPLEQEGVRRAVSAAADAGVLVVLWPADQAEAPRLPAERACMAVRSKADLLRGRGCEDNGWLPVSCLTGQGVDELEDRLARLLAVVPTELSGDVAIAGRHRESLAAALGELEKCPLEEPELAAESLRWVLTRLDELTGDVSDDEVLDRVFATFCVGK